MLRCDPVLIFRLTEVRSQLLAGARLDRLKCRGLDIDIRMNSERFAAASKKYPVGRR